MISSTAEKYKGGAVYTKEDRERRRILENFPEKNTLELSFQGLMEFNESRWPIGYLR